MWPKMQALSMQDLRILVAHTPVEQAWVKQLACSMQEPAELILNVLEAL